MVEIKKQSHDVKQSVCYSEEEILNLFESVDDFQSGFYLNEKSIYDSIHLAYIPDSSADIAHKDDYIATCIFKSYDDPDVRTLRRYRDSVLAETWYGRLSVKTYYFLSPLLVRCFKKTSKLNKFVLRKLTVKVKRLNESGVENTEYEDPVAFWNINNCTNEFDFGISKLNKFLSERFSDINEDEAESNGYENSQSEERDTVVNGSKATYSEISTFEEEIRNTSTEDLKLILDDQQDLYSNEEIRIIKNELKDRLQFT